MFLKEKGDSTIKGRVWSIGTPQHAYIKKGRCSLSNLYNGNSIITAGIDEHERHHVATFNFPTTFRHAETDENVFTRLEGRLAELMGKVDP